MEALLELSYPPSGEGLSGSSYVVSTLESQGDTLTFLDLLTKFRAFGSDYRGPESSHFFELGKSVSVRLLDRLKSAQQDVKTTELAAKWRSQELEQEPQRLHKSIS